VSGLPTIDIEMARLQPVWHGGERDRQRYGTTAGLLLTPLEFFDFYRVLPTSEEFDARQGQALARVEAWEATHREMAGREPVRSMLRWLRMVWTERSTGRFTDSPPRTRPANVALHPTAAVLKSVNAAAGERSR
jgi:hypothetical protein